MEKDFHHHIIYALAKMSGFDRGEAKIIAYASQYVDDNCDREYTVKRDDNEYSITLPNRLPVRDSRFFYPLMTQAVNIKSLDVRTQYYVFMPFHFLPGDFEKEKLDRISNPYCTTRNSENSNIVLDEALRAGDIFRIGVALHTYADTWAHERFTAFNEPGNKVLDWYKDFKALAPNIGHADVWHLPDQICKTWRDHRFDEDVIVNKERAFEAAQNIYKKLQTVRKGKPWDEIRKSVEDIIFLDPSICDADEKKVYDERKRRIERFLKERLHYKEDEWISEVIEFDLEEPRLPLAYEPSEDQKWQPVPINIRLKDNFQTSNWYKFQVAARTQQSQALKLFAKL